MKKKNNATPHKSVRSCEPLPTTNPRDLLMLIDLGLAGTLLSWLLLVVGCMSKRMRERGSSKRKGHGGKNAGIPV